MAQKTRADVRTYWNTNIVQNTTNDITGAELNQGGIDLIDSVAWYDEIPDTFVNTYHLQAAQNVPITDDLPAYTSVLRLSFPLPVAVGTYETIISAVYEMDRAAGETFWRMAAYKQSQVTPPWIEIAEPALGIKAKQTKTFSMATQITGTVGEMVNVDLYAARQQPQDVFIVDNAFISIKRVL